MSRHCNVASRNSTWYLQHWKGSIHLKYTACSRKSECLQAKRWGGYIETSQIDNPNGFNTLYFATLHDSRFMNNTPSFIRLIEFPNRDAVGTSRHYSWRALEAAAEDVMHRHCPNIQDIRRLRAAATLPPTFFFTAANFQLAFSTLLRCIV